MKVKRIFGQIIKMEYSFIHISENMGKEMSSGDEENIGTALRKILSSGQGHRELPTKVKYRK